MSVVYANYIPSFWRTDPEDLQQQLPGFLSLAFQQQFDDVDVAIELRTRRAEQGGQHVALDPARDTVGKHLEAIDQGV